MRAITAPAHRWRALGVAIGLSLAVAVVLGSRVTVGAAGLGAEIRMQASPTGELGLNSGPFLVTEDLRPGGRVAGRLLVRNQTGATLAVTARAEPSTPDLDHALHIRAEASGAVVADGPLGSLAQGFGPIVLASGEEADIVFEASLVPGADHFQGRFVEVGLRLSAEPVDR